MACLVSNKSPFSMEVESSNTWLFVFGTRLQPKGPGNNCICNGASLRDGCATWIAHCRDGPLSWNIVWSFYN